MQVRTILIPALLITAFGAAWVFIGTPNRNAPDANQGAAPGEEPVGDEPTTALLEGESRNVIEIEQAPRTRPKPRPPVVRPEVEAKDLVVEASNKVTRIPNGAVLRNVHVKPGAQLRLPDLGTVFIEGDIRNEGIIDAVRASVMLDGRTQTIEGILEARRIRMTGGLKRVRGAVATMIGRNDDDPKVPELVVGAESTLLLDGKEARAAVSDAYGFRIEGHLVIDGGTFQCTFSNGNGRTTAQSWPEGSRLTIHDGHFIGRGDHDFGQASIEMHAGRIHISDDIWSLGSQLTMYGGTIANSNWGGAFGVDGRVDMHGGTWKVGQRGDRGLHFRASSDARFNGGKIVIGGQHVSGNKGGIYVTGAVHLWDVHLDRGTQIDPRSPGGASLTVAHELTRQKNAPLRDKGYALYVAREIDPHGPKPGDGNVVSPAGSSDVHSPGGNRQPVRPPVSPPPPPGRGR